MKFGWTTLLVVVFLGYILNSVWTLYQLWNIPKCVENSYCFKSSLKPDSKFKVHFYQSKQSKIRNSNKLEQIFVWDDFDYKKSQEKNINVKMIDDAVNNKSIYIYIALVPDIVPNFTQHLTTLQNAYVSTSSGMLTTFMIPEEKSFNLFGGQQEKKSDRESRPISHWKNKLVFEIITDTPGLPQTGLPPEIIRFIKVSPKDEYLPILYVNSMRNRITDLEPLNKTCDTMPLNIVYNPISFGMLRLLVQLDAAMATMKKLGFSEKDIDEVKGIFTDTNFYLLCGTFVIAAFHLLFDFLAFKNDIAFWRKKQTMVGVSIRSVMWRCVSQIIIFLHLLDEETTKLILIPAFLGTLIEVWKVLRAFKIKIHWKIPFPRIEFGSTSDEEKLTSEFDAQIMKYLSYILYPLCIGGAIYSLLYQSHKSCYAWCLQNLVNGVYAFGFIFMLPQLFLNYKLKSIAHLPWRAFMYKAFNTFIDDIFAFIITMPTAHRIACFRDDVVFLVYLYQSWLYPVDKKRVNEYGEHYEDEKKEN